jgi:hypothetical protein
MTWWTTGKPGVNDGRKSLARQVQEWIDGQMPSKRDDGWFVSGLYHLCPRALALQVLLAESLKPVRQFDAGMQHRLDVGTSVHWWWQNCYLGPMGKLLGVWRCLGCGTETLPGKMPQGAHCVQKGRGPGKVFWEYIEPRVVHKEDGWTRPIIGRIDGDIEDTPPEGETDPNGILELKTAHADKLPIQSIPDDYQYQAQAYMWLRDRRWTKFVFINPDGRFYNREEPGLRIPAQEIILRRDDRFKTLIIEKVWAAERALEEFHAVRNARRKFVQWPEKICANKSCFTADRCGVADICFDPVLMERLAIRVAEGKTLGQLLEV